MAKADDDLRQAVASVRQQVTALASVVGVLLAAVRRNGLMEPAFETLLLTELVDAAAAQSEQVRSDWDFVISAVQKISATAGASDRAE
jgi:hypothetical protein